MRLTHEERRAFDASRDIPDKAVRAACYAPFVTMAFQPSGHVLACCRKPATILGDIREQRLDDIWNGPVRRRMAESMKRYEFPSGCDVCAAYISNGDYATADSVRTYDNEQVFAPEPAWPTRLEFNLANTCTLQCVACNGTYSSAIRKHREHLPPLPRVYGDEFFVDLRKYLKHVRTCVFLGGEPFSQQECYRIWDMLAEEGLRPKSYVNTNGMIFNERVERLVSTLPMAIAISFDGSTAETVERLRVGASFATMQEHARHFGRLLSGDQSELVFNFCPMRLNWHEFPGFLEMAEDFGARAYVNTMASPEELSLYHLPTVELQAVISELESHDARLARRLSRNRPTWETFLAMLRAKLVPDTIPGLRQAFTRTQKHFNSMTLPDPAARLRAAEDLLERGQRVLVNPPYSGVLAAHHGNGLYPFYAQRAAGSRIWDAAGNEYIDWYMSGGAVTLGHAHPAVLEAVRAQLEQGMNLSVPCVLEVEVAERLCALVPSAETAIFAKNGTDVTAVAVRLARIVTGREHVLMSGYHGFQDWSWASDPESPGIPAALRDIVHVYGFNDLGSAEALMQRHGREVAAIVLEPLQFDNPDPAFLAGLRALADRYGCLLVFDEIVTGFRVGRGGVQGALGVLPDLTCLSKSLANGLALAALVGPRRLMRHFMHTEFGMTFRRDALAWAAARASLDVHAQQDVSAHLADLGRRLQANFAESAGKAGVDAALVGHPAMLHMRFRAGGRLERRGAEDLFLQVCHRNGVYLQMHRVLPSLAHTLEDVRVTSEVFAEALRSVARAMEQGLEGHLDGPIWKELQKPDPKPARQAAPESSEPAPFEFPHAPEPIRRAGLRLVSLSASGASHVTREAHGLVLRAGEWTHHAPSLCRVEVCELVQGPFRARARYTIEQLPRNDGMIRIQLGARDRKGKEFVVCHDLKFGQASRSRAELGGRSLSSCCPYGVREGTLHLEHDGDLFTGRHETEWLDDLGSLEGGRVGPLQLTFELRGYFEGGPARVALTDLVIEQVTAPGAAAAVRTPGLLRRLWHREG